MDQMDVDHIIEVPDTPDRITAQSMNAKSILDRCRNSSMSGFLENQSRLDGSKTLLKVKDNGFRQLLESQSKSVIPSSVSDQSCSSNFNLGYPPCSNNSSITRKVITTDMPTHEFTRFQPTKNNKKTAYVQTSSDSRPNVEMKEFRGRVGACRKALPLGVQENNRDERSRRKVPLVVGPSSSHSSASSLMTYHAEKNKGKMAERSGSGFDYFNMVTSANNTHHKVANMKTVLTPSEPMNRVTGQKRLVRNGCISPLNIARGKESVGKEKVESDVHNIEGRDRTANAHEPLTSRGKVVLRTPLTIKEPEAQSAAHLSRRDSLITDIVKDSSRSSEELAGWISTRNRSKLSFPSPRGKHNPSNNWVDLSSESPTTMVKKLDFGSASGISLNHAMDLDVASSQGISLPCARPELGHLMGHHPAVNEQTKRQKQRFASSSNGECSRPALNSPEVVLIGSSGNRQRTYETRRNHLDSVVPVIELDETSPAAKVDGPTTQRSNGNDTDAMAIQIEADEILARELQEQYYNEVPSVGVGELDAHLARALQQAYESSPSSSRRRNGSYARGSSTTSSSRQPQQPSTTAAILSHRPSQSRATSSSRMSRVRNRFPGQSRTLSFLRARDSLFPAEMDVELRMHILEELEAINNRGVNNGLLQIQRDFNENDYEILLALDENNNRDGASVAQINGLPQSTVQTDNFEEACAICLDTPEMGDTIRHLPCLHKFHKDCIDPWLRRKTSCPVCKSSIT